jgi:hypothetical protein
MPKRATIIFTSNDGPRQEGPGLFVYYCKYSGKHAFTSGARIAAAWLRMHRASAGRSIMGTSEA